MKYAISTVSHPLSVMIWGAITVQGACNLWFVQRNTTINGETYITILKKEIRKHMRLRRTKIFQQNYAPPHRSKLAKQWLVNQGFKILEE